MCHIGDALVTAGGNTCRFLSVDANAVGRRSAGTKHDQLPAHRIEGEDRSGGADR
jgi:hypothetical protein